MGSDTSEPNQSTTEETLLCRGKSSLFLVPLGDPSLIVSLRVTFGWVLSGHFLSGGHKVRSLTMNVCPAHSVVPRCLWTK